MKLKISVSSKPTDHKLTKAETIQYFKSTSFDVQEIDVTSFEYLLKAGYTFKKTQGHRGAKAEDSYEGFQFITIDIDNKREIRLTEAEILYRLSAHDATPTLHYHTYSSTAEHPRMRLIYVFDSFIHDDSEGSEYADVIGRIAHIFEETIEEEGIVDPASLSYKQVMYAGKRETVKYTGKVYEYSSFVSRLPEAITRKKAKRGNTPKERIENKYTIPYNDEEAKRFLSNPYKYHRDVKFSMTYSNKPVRQGKDLYSVQDEDYEEIILPHDGRKFKDGQRRKMKVANWAMAKWKWMFSENSQHPEFADYRQEVLGFVSYLISRYIDNSDKTITPDEFLYQINYGIRNCEKAYTKGKHVKFNMRAVREEVNTDGTMSKEEVYFEAMKYVRKIASSVTAQVKRDRMAFMVDTEKSFEENLRVLKITANTLKKIIKENGLYILTEKQMERETKRQKTRDYVAKNYKWGASLVSKTIKKDEYLKQVMLSRYEDIVLVFNELGYDIKGEGCEGRIAGNVQTLNRKVKRLEAENAEKDARIEALESKVEEQEIINETQRLINAEQQEKLRLNEEETIQNKNDIASLNSTMVDYAEKHDALEERVSNIEKLQRP